VWHTACNIFIQIHVSTQRRHLQDVSVKACTRINGVQAHPRWLQTHALKRCWCNLLAGSNSWTFSWNKPNSRVKSSELSGTRSAAAIMSPPFAAVSTIRERRAFTSSTAVYSSCLTQTLLQLLKRISVRVLSSTSTGTSTSTRLLQVPRINSMSLCSPCVFHCHSVTTDRCCALLSVAHTTWPVALLGVCYCLTATLKHQTSFVRTNVAWTRSTYCLTMTILARIFSLPCRLSFGFSISKSGINVVFLKHIATEYE
jgi:hypothetical protein